MFSTNWASSVLRVSTTAAMSSAYPTRKASRGICKRNIISMDGTGSDPQAGYYMALYGVVSFVLVLLGVMLMYVACSKRYRLNWFEKNLLESADVEFNRRFAQPSRDHSWLFYIFKLNLRTTGTCHLNLGNLMDVQERNITNSKCRDSGVQGQFDRSSLLPELTVGVGGVCSLTSEVLASLNKGVPPSACFDW
ncbi:hypothetical protein J6590_070580 [Homalodisca vitripennis]|nr:hypothetical protein J6590_070580 [Homalodisca vitripennis]